VKSASKGWKSPWVRVLLVLGLVAVVIQAIPYGRSHAAPLERFEPAWDSPATRTAFLKSCGECHSYETRWPWYSQVAPMSWMVQRHVDEGRGELNVSAWTRTQEEAAEASEKVREREMPLKSYLLLHPEARLDDAERAALIRGLEATFGTESGEEEEHDHT
jgi:hypothetical protein